MILYSTPTSKILSHHDKAYAEFLKWMSYLSKEIRDLKVLVSGSYSMNSLFSPGSPWSDHDYYFLDKNSLHKAVSIVSKDQNITLVCETDNAYTYKYKDSLSFQFVKYIYKSPYKVISSFDFTACAVAFDFKGNIYFTPEALFSWKNKVLDFTNFEEWCSKPDIPQKMSNIFSRLYKYRDRYEFQLSKKAFNDFAAYLNNNKEKSNLKVLSRNSSGIIDSIHSVENSSFAKLSYSEILITLKPLD